MPRFVVLVHDHPFLHWDLLLEQGDRCRAWRLLIAPDPPQPEIPAEGLNDHRRLYLDYEGPVGGDRGRVTQFDHGTFEWMVDGPDVCEILLDGLRCKGRVQLVNGGNGRWRLLRIST